MLSPSLTCRLELRADQQGAIAGPTRIRGVNVYEAAERIFLAERVEIARGAREEIVRTAREHPVEIIALLLISPTARAALECAMA